MPDEFAPAKLNLTLHVTGQRQDGYHVLDSLVVFVAVGDRIRFGPGPLSLRIEGPFTADLEVDDDNLCLRAARLAGLDAAMVLTKNLPVSSGIGGGSADAAAVLRAAERMGLSVPDMPEHLGADVPVCLSLRTARMRGVGEVLEPITAIPDLHLVLINPGHAIATPEVFRALVQKDNPPMPPVPEHSGLDELVEYLCQCRNDLQVPAIGLCPQIGQVLRALEDEGALLARMSGSGATCFGIFADAAAAGLAAYRIGTEHEGWWITATGIAAPSVSV
ncbi:MAG: 4-(cytidine 5'-diphospho)-2-C-methyl-D-erythritol kinase [Paracoccus sp. (in: a-proteobacteria)]